MAADPGHPAAAALGVHPVPLPTPFPVGPVTAWLLLGDPLTLVDAGPASAAALVALEDGLAGHGVRIEDLERLVLTHEHADHVGLASIVADRSGAEVVAVDALAPRLADPRAVEPRETAFLVAVLVRHGVPRDLA
ncbi:MBL fold metallo-hydrolase, partial [Patulibacter sp. S7RM1-6]